MPETMTITRLERYREALLDVIELRRPLEEASEGLRHLGWVHAEQPVVTLTRDHFMTVIDQAAAGMMTAYQVHDWVSAFWCRPGVEPEPFYTRSIDFFRLKLVGTRPDQLEYNQHTAQAIRDILDRNDPAWNPEDAWNDETLPRSTVLGQFKVLLPLLPALFRNAPTWLQCTAGFVLGLGMGLAAGLAVS
ncbi:hypothetical protein [Glycomyces xiaoerkulensis]|uniref:hypothetical protein n=1 Tax=Glycomyces xiaoerkulensis TaxID=2038139 RepID=UPI000C26993E|nr:hypothetical protein [Glycomyces xiaoerkulensis]